MTCGPEGYFTLSPAARRRAEKELRVLEASRAELAKAIDAAPSRQVRRRLQQKGLQQ